MTDQPLDWKTCRCNYCAQIRAADKELRIINYRIVLNRVGSPLCAVLGAYFAATLFDLHDAWRLILSVVNFVSCVMNVGVSHKFWFKLRFISPIRLGTIHHDS